MTRPSIPGLTLAVLVILVALPSASQERAGSHSGLHASHVHDLLDRPGGGAKVLPPKGLTNPSSATADSLPLEAADTLRFTLDEGSWISLDVTPDGESVVFELLGDLYRVPLEGGTAERITHGMGFDSQPRVSPDGEWLAFISDRDGKDNLWVIRMDGTGARKLSSETQDAMISPEWMPDGRSIVVTRRRGQGAQLRLYHVDGGSGVGIGDGAGPGNGPSAGSGATTRRLGATPSPEGRFLYFSQFQGAPGQPFPMWQVARMDLVSGDVDVLTGAEFGAFRPRISPDGRLLVYAVRYEAETGLRVRNLETGDDEWLLWPVQRDEVETGGAPSRDLFPGYAFTPDGSEVVVTFDGKIHRVGLPAGTVTPVPFEARVELAVGPDLNAPYRVEDGPVRATLVQDPVQSPDGTRIAFSVLTKLYVMELERADDGELRGSEPQRLTDGDDWEFKPAWSPDGRWIAYVTWDGGEGHIWRMRADGSGEPQRLTEHASFYTDLVYSPDGARIVGLRGNHWMRQQTFSEFGGLRIPLELIWLPAEGGRVQVVTPARGLSGPHFAGDPERIFVHSGDGLISLRFDGTDRRTHLRVTGPGRAGVPRPPAASAVRMRPMREARQGPAAQPRWALAAVNNQLWVVAVPPFSGETISVNVRSPSLPAHRLTDIGADYLGWADGGETIVWAIGSTIYRRPFDSIEFRPADDEDEDPSDEGGGDEPDPDADPDDDHTPRDLHEAVESVEVVLEFPRARPEGTVVLRGATVITMEDEEIVEDADVVVTDNRIASVGPRGSVPVPDDAAIVDVSGRWIVPGFVDTHAHWEFRTHDVLEPHNWSLIANLPYGVTAGLDVQTSTNDYFAYRDLVETGQALGQRAFMTGPGVFSNTDFQSYEQALDYLRRYRDHYRTPNIKAYVAGNREQRQWIVQAAKELGLMPTTEGARDLRLDLTHAVDGMHGNEHTLPLVPLYRDVTELYARTRTAYTPTLVVQYGGPSAVEWFFTRTEVLEDPKLRRFYPPNRLSEMTRRRRMWARDDEFRIADAARAAREIKRAGGLVGVGGHGEVQGLAYHWEMWSLAMGGFTPREVLEAATIDGARIIGIAEDLGSIRDGKLADLVVLDRDPLEDIENTARIRYVMKNGELFEAETLRQLWPEERDPPRFWWEEGERPEPRADYRRGCTNSTKGG
jgi:Tol biopolymer transport system component